MAITAYSDKPGLGGLSVKKIAGEVVNGNALNVQIDIPVTSVDTVQVENNTYPGVANVAAGAVTVAKGKKLSRITVATPAHLAWFTQKNLNDWIGGAAGFLDANFDTSQWDLNVYEPVLGNRRYTNGKCESIGLVYNANGGPLMVQMSWLAIFGGEEGTPNTFAVPTRVTGQDYNTSDVTSASVDLMRSFILTLGRAQAPQNVADGTFNAIKITSHAIGGTLTLEQSPTASQGLQIGAATATQTGTAIISIGVITTGVQITAYVNRDSRRRAFPGNAPGTEFWDYSLGDFAGVGGTGYPAIIVAHP